MATKHIVLITGANSGIGYEAVKTMWSSQQPYHILAAGRSPEKLKQAMAEITATPSAGSSSIEEVVIDIADDASITRAFEHVSAMQGRLDTLVNNAGGSFDTDLAAGRSTMREAWNRTLDLNITSPQVVTFTFAPLLLRSASPRLLFVTSGMSSLGENFRQDGPASTRRPPIAAGWPKKEHNFEAYMASKTGLNMMFRRWCRLFEQDGVKCFDISPGFLATGLGRDGISRDQMAKAGAGDASVGGIFIKDVVDGKRDQDAGQVIRSDSIQGW